MSVVLTNNASSRLAVALTAGATSFAVTTGEGAKFPTVASGSGAWFPITLIKASGALEIVRCTARSGDVFTVTRAQEGTAAQAFSVGDRAELRLTAAALSEFKQTDTISTFMQGMLDDADAAEARTTLGLGTAATRNVETDPLGINTNPIAYGAFGLGNAVTLAGGTNLNSLVQPATYTFTSGAALGNAPASGACVVTVTGRAAYPHQEFRPIYGRKIYTRSAKTANPTTSAADWNDWSETYTTENVSAFVQTLLDDADAAAARATLGLGTSAVAALTTSATDQTAGRIPKNGDKSICTAWVSFIGSGTVTIRDSLNVSSITDNGVGRYSINFATAMADTNYSAVAMSSSSDTSGAWAFREDTNLVRNTGRVAILNGGGSGAVADPSLASVQVFGGK